LIGALSEFIGESGFNRDGICTEPGFSRTLGQVENEKSLLTCLHF
jgi:hypothetical protein